MEDYDAPEVGTHPQISFLKKGPPQSANPTALSLTFKEVTVITEAMTECVPFSYVLIFLLLPTTDWTTSGPSTCSALPFLTLSHRKIPPSTTGSTNLRKHTFISSSLAVNIS